MYPVQYTEPETPFTMRKRSYLDMWSPNARCHTEIDIDHMINLQSIKMRNDANLVKSSGNTYKNNSTMESHFMLQVSKIDKTTKDSMWKSETDIHEDTDVESFLMVSQLDVPAMDFIESLMSCISQVCRNLGKSLNSVSGLYCKPESAQMSVKRPSMKLHHRRIITAVAVSRGRGRGKGQLRRSGVSQTICRMECVKHEDHELMQYPLVDAASNDCLLDCNFDNFNISDLTYPTKLLNCPLMSSSPKSPTKGKPNARKKRSKARCATKVRHTAKPSMINVSKDNDSEISDAQEDTLHSMEYFFDDEDGWIFCKEVGDDKLPKTREKQGATEYPTRARHVHNSPMKKYKDFTSEIHEKNIYIHNSEGASSRLRSSSESSIEFEGNNHNFTALDEQETTDSNNSYAAEASDDDFEISFCDEDKDESIVFVDQDYEELTARKKVNFNLTPVVHAIITWDYAYRAARKGPWEEMARDRERFRNHINRIAPIIDPVLKNAHRLQVWQERFASLE
ncbi:PREDICTED: uncharacterized protein LOC105561165 isoform X2 [Vollenhovia emeryi]|uniref:uncharacterized protein LOC105561165 isoform X2 n=1 Tax=Vollenhovia emeryi TaxID=411798 RepID=UPI0005F44A49|nr:PREDICTED: uncharacterized protein LOC105561165 isoform X2 [Vollenhovia emeryi]